ncbi:MAG: phytoene desaturase [Flavobacteriales bacterium]|nr:phytoene desaturase [Flavobacteriales bacterium]
MRKVNIIGSGFASLSAACYLSQAGFDVSVFEKNDQLGGRAKLWKHEGFTFDMGPSWYWMPDIFERFFGDFGHKAVHFYELVRLNPSYRVFFEDKPNVSLPANYQEILNLFESIEKGASAKLHSFLERCKENYHVSMQSLVYKPGKSPFELVTKETALKLQEFVKTVGADVRKQFKDERLRQILEFPVLFLGAKPANTPSFYNLMNYADMVLGTWYPMGGMYEIVKAMVAIAENNGVKFHTNASVESIKVIANKTIGIVSNGFFYESDYVLSGADYRHTEQLLEKQYRYYSDEYWRGLTFAPSALVYYVGFDKKLQNLEHHNLFFDANFEIHSAEIYDNPKWPSKPLFYASFPSLTDTSVAPMGKELGFFLIPIATKIDDTPEMRERYFEQILNRIELHTKQNLKDSILFQRSYCINDFKQDYNAAFGNAYGLANTLKQTAFLRPKIKSKMVENLFFTGQLTVPGPGVPPALISGKIASNEIIKTHKKSNYATI